MRYKILILVPNQLYKSSTESPKDAVPVGQFLSHSCIILMLCLGDCKARNETETKRNETKQNETKRNKTKRNETKRDTTETKQDKAETKRNEAKPNETIKIINK